ncbi:MAG: SDR family NAD(P)-dependent oxidoreductase [Promethearchaeota archaeon]
MANVVITGSTSGLGKALATEFLERGDNVIITSRNQDRVDRTVEELKKVFPNVKIFGISCNVGNPDELSELGKFAVEKLGDIHFWINNAGVKPKGNGTLMDGDPVEIKRAIDTNIYGSLMGTREAFHIMKKQGYGHIFNMEGLGSRGRIEKSGNIYAISKSPFVYILKALQKEIEGTGIGIHDLSPGMVITGLLTTNAMPRAQKIINILADRPEIVAKNLVPKIKKVKGSGKLLAHLTMKKSMWRFITANSRKNRFFDENGELKEK